MRIQGPNATGAAATPTVRRTGGSGFSLGLQDARPAASGTQPVATVGSLDALMALQGVEDATERRRKAIRRGRVALDLLENIKIGLLSGEMDPAALTRLKAAAGELKLETGDPGLDAVLAEIDLRVEVELAKAGLF